MKLGNHHAGIRIERAMWGMPARVVVYGGRDPFAGPGGIPWRFYWSRDLRWLVRLRFYWTFEPDQSTAWTGRDSRLAWVEIEWGWGWKARQVRTVWRHRRYDSPRYWAAVRPGSIVKQGAKP